jgi:hypothetical protein
VILTVDNQSPTLFPWLTNGANALSISQLTSPDVGTY